MTTDPRNEADYDTYEYGTEPIPGDQTWGSTQITPSTLDKAEIQTIYEIGRNRWTGYATPEDAGIAAVLDYVVDVAQKYAADRADRYDHRSLWEFAAQLTHVVRGMRKA